MARRLKDHRHPPISASWTHETRAVLHETEVVQKRQREKHLANSYRSEAAIWTEYKGYWMKKKAGRFRKPKGNKEVNR
jgi:hypothetical protein